MPIWEYRCINCGHAVEKITLKANVKVPDEIGETCPKCQGRTRHRREVPRPAIMKAGKPGTRSDGTPRSMKELRPARDKHWKQRVKEGLAPDGKTKLTDLKAESMKDWAGIVAQSVGGDGALQDAAKEAKEIAASVGFEYTSPVAAVREAAKRGDPIPEHQPRMIRRK